MDTWKYDVIVNFYNTTILAQRFQRSLRTNFTQIMLEFSSEFVILTMCTHLTFLRRINVLFIIEEFKLFIL